MDLNIDLFGGIFMLYKEIFTDDFLNKFGEYKNKIANIELTNYGIDVEKIAKICGIKVNYSASETSGWSIYEKKDDNSNDKKEILINELEPKYRQNFTLAHEVGHIILGHTGKSYRNYDINQYDTIDRMNEVLANKFAAELIMPKKLVVTVLKKNIKCLNYQEDTFLDDSEMNNLIEKSAKDLNVSYQALKYRMDNLGVLVNE